MDVIPGSDPPSPLEIDHFDLLPDSILLLVFNKIGDVKALGRCCVVSRRFHSLVPQVENVVVRVDCVISDDDSSSLSSIKSRSAASISAGSFSAIFRLVVGGIVKPLQALGQFLGTKRSCGSESSSSSSSSSLSISGDESGEIEQGGVTHHSPTQVLKNFDEIRYLRIDLPSGELGIDDGVLLKWRAEFGSTLDNCVILGASSVIQPNPMPISPSMDTTMLESSSSLWYELQYLEAKDRMKNGDRVWQIGFGSGFKANSAVWKCISEINSKERNAWSDRIHLYPVCGDGSSSELTTKLLS